MSAWIVSKLHIDVMVQALQQGEIVVDRTSDELGRALWLENVASIHGRYPAAAVNDDYPGPDGFLQADAQNYVYEPPTKDRLRDAYNHRHYQLPGDEDVSAPDVLLKIFDCYDYQTCEHAAYESSEAYKWVQVMKGNLTRAGAYAGEFTNGVTVPGNPAYERAPWGL